MSPTHHHFAHLHLHHRTPSSLAQNPNARIATKPSPAPWADTPYRLIDTPRNLKAYSNQSFENGLVYVASEMANVHNMILRGLNSIMQQGPHVPDAGEPGYFLQDVKDFLFYVSAWCKVLDHHLDMEETIFYPAVENMTRVKFLMDELQEQHEEFDDDFVSLQEYVEKVCERPYQYRWHTMKKLIEAFSSVLTYHLHDEIDFLLSMDRFNSEGLRRCWKESLRIVMSVEDSTMMHEILPFMLGNSDKTYEGGNDFPCLPKSLRYAVKYRFSKKHHGSWRFNSCTLSRKPVPLRMLPENRISE